MIFKKDIDLADVKREARSNLIKAITILVVVFVVAFTLVTRDVKMGQLNERSLIRYYELTILDPENEFYQQRYKHYNLLVNGE